MLFDCTLFLVNTISLLCAIPTIWTVSVDPLLLLVSFDGFRYDLLSSKLTPNLWRLAKNGVRFKNGVKPLFETVTSPNHVSLVTGLYQESHGIVSNEFYDPKLDQFYDLFNFSGDAERYQNSKRGYWYSGEPVWLTNQRSPSLSGGNRRFSGSMYWPAGDVNILGEFASIYRTWEDFGDLESWKESIDELLSWFTRDVDPINFGMFYISQPDEVMHHTGVTSTNTSEVVQDLDVLVGFVEKRLKDEQLWGKLNLIFTADHGHMEVPYPDNAIPIKEYLPLIPSDMVWSGHTLMVKPGANVDVQAVLDNLTDVILHRDKQHIQIFLKSDFENEIYHYTNSDRVGEIMFLLDPHYTIDFKLSKAELDAQPKSLRSNHQGKPGDPGMQQFLVLHGPAFKQKLVVDSHAVQIIDLYPLMCRVLKISPRPNNGSLEIIGDALASIKNESYLPVNRSLAVLLFVCLMIAAVSFACCLLVYAVCGRGRPFKPTQSVLYSKLDQNPRTNSSDDSELVQASGRANRGSVLGRDKDWDSWSEEEEEL